MVNTDFDISNPTIKNINYQAPIPKVTDIKYLEKRISFFKRETILKKLNDAIKTVNETINDWHFIRKV